jgi:hypothetical protein
VSPKKASSGRRARVTRVVAIVGAVVAVLLVLAIAAPLAATSSADFFGRYHLLNRRFVNLENSAHEGIGCRACHETRPIANGLQLTADFYTSLFKTGNTPKYFKFEKPRNEACLKCHEDDWSSDAKRTARIPHPAHTRVADETRECVKCHKWTAHLETYMPKHKKMPFSGVCVAYGCHVGVKQKDQCFDCHHVLHENADQWDIKHPTVVKTTGENACLESCHQVTQCQLCHTTGVKPQFTGLTIEIGMKPIEKLHVKADWTQKYHGAEALKDRSKCLLCHQSQGECQECHRFRPQFHGTSSLTWIGTHNKSTKNVKDPRCIECHKQSFCDDCHKQFEEME